MSGTQSPSSPYAESPVTVAQAFVDGRAAGEAGKQVDSCPYPQGTNEHGAWHRGYSFAASTRETANPVRQSTLRQVTSVQGPRHTA